ncbi:hypothetical protein CANTEDRAFT_120975 [Yamadazyma tenuis ATCC 10573]|uniref:Ribosomal protein L19 n=2 Tax=Candida tenuis TaxID=2315449 RepID=G3B137_CANTC|nr:uncharacterized protein CANTEDRAFT_120975 [Yamadazyma tenuis ATCC 10573]XP_006685677.1 uncharacterized protein CANTEDRAFT_120975 [Yamadazyma tenuis ATCC 10573]EGV64870.1 hypothetical protein CANTEDRAFT_120975 [Yamadazyma tenuis ATCC 10573]EGV64871.1 hypothetical protein CANTEDRAFT_120975 [Yamadazyma tenuis ATCC 10573]
MFTRFTSGLKPLRISVQAIRTFIPTVKASSQTPTVFEPLPSKRNGQSVMKYLHEKLTKKYDPTGKRTALVDQQKGLRSGDIIKVTYLDRTSVVGQIIAIKRSVRNVGTNILLRNKINKLGVEVRIPLYNPKIRNIEVLYKPKKYMPRRKHFYIRNTKYDVGDVEAFLSREKRKQDS